MTNDIVDENTKIQYTNQSMVRGFCMNNKELLIGYSFKFPSTEDEYSMKADGDKEISEVQTKEISIVGVGPESIKFNLSVSGDLQNKGEFLSYKEFADGLEDDEYWSLQWLKNLTERI